MVVPGMLVAVVQVVCSPVQQLPMPRALVWWWVQAVMVRRLVEHQLKVATVPCHLWRLRLSAVVLVLAVAIRLR